MKDFKEEDWGFEVNSGFSGYRNDHTKEWIYENDYHNRRERKNSYEKDWNLLHEFRRDCLPFGEYGDNILRKFLDKRYEMD